MARRRKNRNIVLIKNVSELEDELAYNDFGYKDDCTHICNVIPYKEKFTIRENGYTQK